MSTEELPFRVAFVPGVTVSKWARVWPERRPHVPLSLLPIEQVTQEDTLHRGDADMVFVRLPIGRNGLNVIPLYEETAFVVVPREHPIALFDEVTAADLAGEEMLTDAAEDAIALVAAGAGVTVLPQSIVRLHGRKDVVARPVTDAPTTTIGLAWLSTQQEDDRIEEFIGIVRGRTARSSRGASVGSESGGRAKATTRKNPSGGRSPRTGQAPKPGERRQGR